MKVLIRIICFVITTLIFVPIETALSGVGTAKPLIWLIAIAIYFFMFYIPSNALITMWSKRSPSAPAPKNNCSTPAAGSVPPPAPSPVPGVSVVSNPRYRPNKDTKISIRTADGALLRLPAYHVDRMHAAERASADHRDIKWQDQYSADANQIATRLNAITADYIKHTGSPKDLIFFTVVWTALFYSVLDILKANHISYEVENQFHIINTNSFGTGDSQKAPRADMMDKCHFGILKCLIEKNIDPYTPDGASELLSFVLRYKSHGSDNNVPHADYPNAIESMEFSLALTDATTSIAEFFAH